MRATYEDYLAHPERLESILLDGAAKARRLATPFMTELRQAVGLRRLSALSTQPEAAVIEKAALPVFKQYRESDGQFYFKLNDGQGRLLLQSTGFAQPKAAGQAIALLKQAPESAVDSLRGQWQAGQGVSEDDIIEALNRLRLASAD